MAFILILENRMFFNRLALRCEKFNRVIYLSSRNVSLLFGKNTPPALCVKSMTRCNMNKHQNEMSLIDRRYLTSTAGDNNSTDSKNSKTTNNNEQTNQQQQQQQEPEQPFEEIILNNALKFVPELGFTEEAISRAIAEHGLSTAAKGIFQNGPFDLIDFFYKKCNAELAVYLEKMIGEGKITRKNELVREALLYRLSLIQPYIQHWPQVNQLVQD
jgi:hypothetical protein